MLAGAVLASFLLMEVARLICWRMGVEPGEVLVVLVIILGVLLGIAVGLLSEREQDGDDE